MKLIRNGIFETNSSSTHSLVLCMADDIVQWKEGKKLYIRNENKLIDTGKELNDYCAKNIIYSKLKPVTVDGDRYFVYNDAKYKEIKDVYTEENISEFTEDVLKEWFDKEMDDYDKPLTYNEYWDRVDADGFCGFEQSLTTPSGVVTAFGYYGNDY